MWLLTLALAGPVMLTQDPAFAADGSLQLAAPSGRVIGWMLDHVGPSSVRVVWKTPSDRPWLFRAGHAPVELPVPDGMGETRHRLALPGIAVSPDVAWVALRFPSGALTVADPSGRLLWSAPADVERVDGPHVVFDVVYPPDRSGPEWVCGNSDPEQVGPPRISADGSVVVAVGRVGEGPERVVHVWEADTGEVRHRFVFDAPTQLYGFRSDGRLVVRAAKTVFALPLGLPLGTPEVLAENEVFVSVVDGEVRLGDPDDLPRGL